MNVKRNSGGIKWREMVPECIKTMCSVVSFFPQNSFLMYCIIMVRIPLHPCAAFSLNSPISIAPAQLKASFKEAPHELLMQMVCHVCECVRVMECQQTPLCSCVWMRASLRACFSDAAKTWDQRAIRSRFDPITNELQACRAELR